MIDTWTVSAFWRCPDDFAVAQGLLKQLPHLVDVLDGKHTTTASSSGSSTGAGGKTNGMIAQETPFGQLAPPLGSARLKAVEVIYALLNQSDAAAEEGIMESGAIMKCLDLFTEYPFNNLLHHRVSPCPYILMCMNITAAFPSGYGARSAL